MGVALLAGTGQRHHGACPPRRRLRRDGEPGGERPYRPPSRSSGRARRSPTSRWRPRAPRCRRRRTGRAVDKSHAEVYSTPESPVSYNAFDKDLQLWVAACIYKGIVDVLRIFVGEMDDETADRIYRGERRTGHDAASSRGDVAGGPGRVRPVLGGVAGQGAHRRRRPRVSLPDRRGPGAWGEAAGVGAAQAGQFQSADHGRLSAATVPRRDASWSGTRRSSAASTG